MDSQCIKKHLLLTALIDITPRTYITVSRLKYAKPSFFSFDFTPWEIR